VLSRITVKNLVKIGQSVVKILQFMNFLRWRPSAILDLFGANLDNRRRVLGGLYHCANFRNNRSVVVSKIR